MIRRTKAQRIDQCNRTRAHGEHVAQDAAYARRCALIGLDVGRVVMRLHLEDRRLPVTDINDACILTRPLNNAVILGREL